MRPPPLAPPVSPRAGSPAPQRLHAARYRVWQMWRALFPGRLDAADRAILEQTLPPAGRAPFAAMAANDQRHSLAVYRALRARGRDHAGVLGAALLHDSGKGGGRGRVGMRPTGGVLCALAP